MTKLSRFGLDPEKLGHYINNLWSAFTVLDTKDDIRLLFRDIFSHTEYKMFAKRLEIARRLLAGQDYESIKKALNVTGTTIAKINNILAEKGDGFRKVDSRLTEIEKRRLNKEQERIDYITKDKRRKPASETFLFDATKEVATKLNKVIRKKQKIKSVSRQLSVY